jgi:GT2 family glycosyltransferase
VSVIICNLNGMRFLPRLIETVRGQRGVETEIIVVDRESRDGSLTFLAGMPDVRVLSEPAATGLVAGYHVGSKHASHDLFFFCNEDLWLEEDCLAQLRKHISVERRIGAADPWQYSYDGSRELRKGMRFYPAFLDRINCYPPRAMDFLAPLASGDVAAFGCGGAVMIHRAMYDAAGGWDSTFFLEFEEIDLFLRAWQKGWRCVTEPAAKYYHAVGQSTVQAGLPPTQVMRMRRVAGESNRAVICLKHFTGTALLWAPFILLRPLIANSLRGRFREAGIYVSALALTWRRLPAVRAFRHASAVERAQHPGQTYFTQPEFQSPGRV